MTLVAIYYNPPSQQEISPNHSKWKRGLAFISPKNYYNKKKYKSATTAAAATEKVLCHSKVKCEDLTAKEFAKMAGIKIKVEEEEQLQTMSSYPDEPMLTQMTSISTRTAHSSKSCHQIWESDFWQCQPSKLCKLSTSSTNDTLLSKTCSSSQFTVIQKGRFKIVVGQQDDDEEPIHPHQPIVLEWKRKRSNSSATKS